MSADALVIHHQGISRHNIDTENWHHTFSIIKQNIQLVSEIEFQNTQKYKIPLDYISSYITIAQTLK